MIKSMPSATPESQGIASRDLLRLLDELEASGTEMHGLMVLRRGRVLAQGWWAPFAQGTPHGSQSLTKTVTGTAFGIAMGEGLLQLDERLVDIFPEFVPEQPDPRLGDLRMRHILTMGSGMEAMPPVYDPEWIRKFFLMPIVHQPGGAFFYNSVACSLVGACIRKKTGLGLADYLRPRLFDKIGIDAGRIRWYCHEDGQENGSGGIVTTTEDNARLLQLYLQDGCWDSQRILPLEWVRFATAMQNDHFRETAPDAYPGQGYGGMMWIREGAFYADGALGQLAIGFPGQELLISVNQVCVGREANRKMLAALFEFPACAQDRPLPEDPEANTRLARRLNTLALPAPAYAPDNEATAATIGRRCRVTQGRVVFFPEDLAIYNRGYHDVVSSIGFARQGGALQLSLESESGSHVVFAGLDGRARANSLTGRIPASDVLLSAAWTDGGILQLAIRWLDVCRTRRIDFEFGETGVKIRSSVSQVGGFDAAPLEAFAVWEQQGQG
jgi:CubicO group peptidase (beta-lactamase class C family)